jgi:hypothetical protein
MFGGRADRRAGARAGRADEGGARPARHRRSTRPGPPAPSAAGRVARAAPEESVSRWRTDGSAKVSRGVKAGDVAEDGPLQPQWLRQTNVWRGGTSPHGSQKRLRSVKSATKINDGSREGWDEMAHDPREDPEVVVNTFLQHKSLEQTQDYLARGRRFAKLDMQRLNKGWIIAVRGWLAIFGTHKGGGAEIFILQQSNTKSNRTPLQSTLTRLQLPPNFASLRKLHVPFVFLTNLE